MLTFCCNQQYRQSECDKIPKVPIPRARISYVRILWIFPIENATYHALRQFYFHGDFQDQSLQFCSSVVRKNTGNYLPKMTFKWERMRTAISDLPGTRLGFCLNNSIFVSKNCSKLFGNVKKHFQVCLLLLFLLRVPIIGETTQRQTSLRSKGDARQITYPTTTLTIASNLMKENLWRTKNGCPFITNNELRKKSTEKYVGVGQKGQKQQITTITDKLDRDTSPNHYSIPKMLQI